jgi:hypothetical protein
VGYGIKGLAILLVCLYCTCMEFGIMVSQQAIVENSDVSEKRYRNAETLIKWEFKSFWQFTKRKNFEQVEFQRYFDQNISQVFKELHVEDNEIVECLHYSKCIKDILLDYPQVFTFNGKSIHLMICIGYLSVCATRRVRLDKSELLNVVQYFQCAKGKTLTALSKIVKMLVNIAKTFSFFSDVTPYKLYRLLGPVIEHVQMKLLETTNYSA